MTSVFVTLYHRPACVCDVCVFLCQNKCVVEESVCVCVYEFRRVRIKLIPKCGVHGFSCAACRRPQLLLALRARESP